MSWVPVLVGWLVYPHGFGEGGWFGVFADQPFRVAGVGGGQDVGADRVCHVRLPVVDVVGSVPGDARVPVLSVVPGEETLPERQCVGDRAEGLREVGPVLQGPELRLGVRVDTPIDVKLHGQDLLWCRW